MRTNPVWNFEHVFDPAGQEAGEFNSYSCCHYWDTRYFRVGGRLLGEYFGGSNTFFIHSTALGSTVQVTDQTGIVQEDTQLYPWGQPWKQGGASYDNHFAGFQLRDTNVSADPTPNRWYTYGVGRWPSPDPPGKGAVHLDDPQTWNMYAYVRNNPTTLTDPSGLCEEAISCGALLGAGIGTAVAPGRGTAAGATIGIGIGIVVDVGIGGYLIYRHFANRSPAATSSLSKQGMEEGKTSNPARPGTLGKRDHQETAAEEAARIGGKREVKIDTPGSAEYDFRRADAAQVGSDGKYLPGGEIVQVYRPTRAGNVPQREKDAAQDIRNATGVKPQLVPVRKCPPSECSDVPK